MKESSLKARALLPVSGTLLAAVVAMGCGGGSSSGVSPTAPATGEPTAARSPTAPAPAPTLEPLEAVTLGGRVTFYGTDAGDGATALATGDFNGDGVPDVVLSAAFADGPLNGRPDAGEAYLFFGPFAPGEARDSAASEHDVTIFGAAAGDQMGRAVAAADVDGDALDDLVLGAPFADGPADERPDAGETYILSGRRSWPATIDLATEPAAAAAFGADEEDLSGFSLATPDANGDGVHDLLIGAFWADGPDNSRANAGEASVIFGERDWPPTIDLGAGEHDVIVYGADEGDQLTETVATGDVNGDGVADLALSATFASGPGNQRPKAGEVHVILGGQMEPTYDLAQRPGRIVVLGPDEGDQIGHSAATGDFDGDGIGDLLLGAVSADGPDNSLDLAGEAYLVPGGATLPASVDTLERGEALRILGADSADRLGRGAAAGDLNGDGTSDLILAASGADGLDQTREDAGEVYVIYGRPGLTGFMNLARQAPDIAFEGLDPNDALGQNAFGKPTLLSADMDGDGLDDVLVAALGDGPANDRPDAGEAYVLFARR